MDISPETKDWTWVLERPCPECGFDATAITPPAIADIVARIAPTWREALHRPDAAQRPRPGTWSPVEYAAHTTDVCGVFTRRLRQILETDNPTFADWDPNEAAVAGHYRDRPAGEQSEALIAAMTAAGDTFGRVPDSAWDRPGMRSDGARFTAQTLGRYFSHELVHHLHDVRP